MEQKDYLLREIEKLGMLLRAILNSLIGRNENLAIKADPHFEETKELLLNETGFDIDKFLTLDEWASNEYLAHFHGINVVNLELLAEVIFLIGINNKSETQRTVLQKALRLYELCNLTDKTFSVDRENQIKKIRDAL